ncbi:F-box family protein [Dorcoceras hygrometricum]|uniref:F-box family protein n=1 Tax=Dorcoceras hygrometricum TaxID=472368 RepID=A0A2Z7CHY4_9LAMI|nr:F-box family protein [Dorcoceras hygrometricum]
MIQSARREAITQDNVLSINLNEFRKGVQGHSSFITSDLADVRKEQKEQRAMLEGLDEQVATMRNDLLDFRAKGIKRRRLREVWLHVLKSEDALAWGNRVCVSAGCSAEAVVNAGQISCSAKRKVVVLLLRLDVQLREIFTTLACDWYQQREVLCVVVFLRLVTQLLSTVRPELFRRIPVVSGGCFARVRLLPESSGFLVVTSGCLLSSWLSVTLGRCDGERLYRTLISLLGLLATMRRVVNYHSSWARQQQAELFDASGNPGSTAGRGFNPVGGAPGGG